MDISKLEVIKVKNRKCYKTECTQCQKVLYRTKLSLETLQFPKLCSSCVITNRNKTVKHYKHSHNRNYFKELSFQSAYWAGFIAADGCLSDKKTISIKINKKDIDRLNQFLKDIDSSASVLNSGNENRKRVIITSPECWKDLNIIYNLTPRKSLTLTPPNIHSEELIKAFIIGYIDGDGSICFCGPNQYLKLSIVGTFEFLNWIKFYFDSWVDTTKAKKEIQQKTTKSGALVYEYTVYGKRALKLINLLKEIPLNKMKRKWENPLLLNYNL